MRDRSGYLPTLDGWRAVAIIGVILAHGRAALFGPTGLFPSTIAERLAVHGSLGVDIFFGISGFLITSRLLSEERALGGISLPKFYLRRAFRILPPYLSFLTVLFGITLIARLPVSAGEWKTCLLFLRNYLPSSEGAGWYTGHFWSLAVEEHFYLLWPGLLVLLGSRRARGAVPALAIVITVWRTLDFRHQWVAHLLPGVGFLTRTDVRLDALLWGAWAALLFEDPEWRARLTRRLTPWVAPVAITLFALCVAIGPPLQLLWQSLLIVLALVATVINPGTRLGRLLELRLPRHIGRISYGLYVWQQLFCVGPEHLGELGSLQRMPFNLIVVVAIAELSFHVLEKPLLRKGHALAGRIGISGAAIPSESVV